MPPSVQSSVVVGLKLGSSLPRKRLDHFLRQMIWLRSRDVILICAYFTTNPVSYHFYVDSFEWGVDLIKPVSMSVRTSVRPCTKSFSDLSEIWCVSRWYAIWPDPRSRRHGHVALKVRNSSIFGVFGHCDYSVCLLLVCFFHLCAVFLTNKVAYFQNLSPLSFSVGAGKWLLILKLEDNI